MKLSCFDPTSQATTYGEEACTEIINAYAATFSAPAACKGEEACNAAIQCFGGNNANGIEYTTTDNCDLVARLYGYSQWQDKASITCVDTGLENQTGYANCM